LTTKTILLALISSALLSSGPLRAQATAQADDDSPSDAARSDVEEVIVRGRRMSDFRSALETARVRIYDLFNDLNSDDAFDVHCQHEAATGTRIRQHICRPRFIDDISSAAAQAWMDGLRDACPDGVTQDCIFSESAQQAMSMAQAEEALQPVMQQQFELEMARVIAESPELQQAVLDYQALERSYDEARGGRRARRCAGASPPPRCSR